MKTEIFIRLKHETIDQSMAEYRKMLDGTHTGPVRALDQSAARVRPSAALATTLLH